MTYVDVDYHYRPLANRVRLSVNEDIEWCECSSPHFKKQNGYKCLCCGKRMASYFWHEADESFWKDKKP